MTRAKFPERNILAEIDEELRALSEEFKESSPRGTIALAEALFENSLFVGILFHLAADEEAPKRPWILPEAKRKRLEDSIPQRSLRKLVAHALKLGVLPQESDGPLSRALDIRNGAVHKPAALTSDEEEKVGAAVQYFDEMRLYLMLRYSSQSPRISLTSGVAVPSWS